LCNNWVSTGNGSNDDDELLGYNNGGIWIYCECSCIKTVSECVDSALLTVLTVLMVCMTELPVFIGLLPEIDPL